MTTPNLPAAAAPAPAPGSTVDGGGDDGGGDSDAAADSARQLGLLDDNPPFLGSWRNIHLLLALSLVLMIAFFTALTGFYR